jgi:hypothetical protein
MYRKIISLSINFAEGINDFMKSSLLLMMSFFFAMLMIDNFPFAKKKMNLMEFYSNSSLAFIAFSSYFLVENGTEFIKLLCFILIVASSLRFLLFAFSEIVKIMYQTFFNMTLKKMRSALKNIKIFLRLEKLNMRSEMPHYDHIKAKTKGFLLENQQRKKHNINETLKMDYKEERFLIKL